MTTPVQSATSSPGAGAIPIVTRVLADPVRMYLPSAYWNRARDFFSYNLDFNPLTASGISTDTFTVQNDSDFLCLSVTGSAATAAAGTTERAYLPYLIQVQDSSSAANWFGGDDAGYTHIQNFIERISAGTANIAVTSHYLDHPRFIPAASAVTVNINNLSANADRLWLSFRGLKLYQKIRQGG
jgi:hypothetical protein